jgi:hypothetical protein
LNKRDINDYSMDMMIFDLYWSLSINLLGVKIIIRSREYQRISEPERRTAIEIWNTKAAEWTMKVETSCRSESEKRAGREAEQKTMV